MNIHSDRLPDGRFALAEKPAARRIEVWLDDSTIELIDAAAKQNGVGRGKAISLLLSNSADHQWSAVDSGQPAPTTSGPAPTASGPVPNYSDVEKALSWAFAIGAQALGELSEDSLEEGKTYEVAEGVRQEVLDRMAEDFPWIPLQTTAKLSDLETVWFELLVHRLDQNVDQRLFWDTNPVL